MLLRVCPPGRLSVKNWVRLYGKKERDEGKEKKRRKKKKEKKERKKKSEKSEKRVEGKKAVKL